MRMDRRILRRFRQFGRCDGLCFADCSPRRKPRTTLRATANARSICQVQKWQNVEKTAPANRKKSCAKTQIRAVPFRAAQVCLGKAHSSCERSAKAGAGQGMPPVHREARVTNPANWSPLIYNFPPYVRLVDQELGKNTSRGRIENETGIGCRTYRRTIIINRVQMRIGMMM